jgi:hypothetical protein
LRKMKKNVSITERPSLPYMLYICFYNFLRSVPTYVSTYDVTLSKLAGVAIQELVLLMISAVSYLSVTQFVYAR